MRAMACRRTGCTGFSISPCGTQPVSTPEKTARSCYPWRVLVNFAAFLDLAEVEPTAEGRHDRHWRVKKRPLLTEAVRFSIPRERDLIQRLALVTVVLRPFPPSIVFSHSRVTATMGWQKMPSGLRNLVGAIPRCECHGL
jgi:hypothetical protein